MRHIATVLAVALVATGCGKQISADEARNAIPEPAELRIDTPKDAADASAVQLQKAGGAVAAAAEADPAFDPGFLDTTNSDFAKWSYVTAWTVNGGAWWTLAVVQFIVHQPFLQPDCSGDTCTWGPWEDESKVTPGLMVKRWQLSVTKVDEGKFEYVLAAQNLVEPGPFLPIVSGVAYPSAPGTGHGEVTISFDNARLLPEPEDDYGTLTIRYDNRTATRIAAEIVGARDEGNGNPLNAAYEFLADADGGDLQVAFEGEDEQANPIALSLHTRWDGTGAGRGDARIIVQDAGGLWSFTGGASECWAGASGAFQLSYDTDPSFGEVGACAAGFQGEPQYSTLVVP